MATPHHIFDGNSVNALFNKIDTDGDGVISAAEWSQAQAARGASPITYSTPQYMPVQSVATRSVTVAPVNVPAPYVMTSVAASSMTAPAAGPVVYSAPTAATGGAFSLLPADQRQLFQNALAEPAAAPVAAAAPRNDLFDQIDLDHDGTISRAEWASHQRFTAFDRNHDGTISLQEFQQGARTNVAPAEYFQPVNPSA